MFQFVDQLCSGDLVCPNLKMNNLFLHLLSTVYHHAQYLSIVIVSFPFNSAFLPLPQAAKANLEKAHADMAGTSDEMARAEVQVRIDANEAIVKALE